MFSGATQAVRRFSLLLLDEGELYVSDWVASARWPPGVAGNWQRLPRLPGQLRLCTRSLFFEPDDVRVPIVRCGPLALAAGCLLRRSRLPGSMSQLVVSAGCAAWRSLGTLLSPSLPPPPCTRCRLPFQFVEGLEGSGERTLTLTTTRLVKMRANAADAPYAVEKAVERGGAAAAGGQHAAGGSGQGGEGGEGAAFSWEFELAYARLEGVMPLAQQMVVASRLPPGDREDFLQARRWAGGQGRRRLELGLFAGLCGFGGAPHGQTPCLPPALPPCRPPWRRPRRARASTWGTCAPLGRGSSWSWAARCSARWAEG